MLALVRFSLRHFGRRASGFPARCDVRRWKSVRTVEPNPGPESAGYPNPEEEFVFLDCVDPEEELPHKEEDFLLHLSSTHSASPKEQKPSGVLAHEKHQRVLERQLQAMKSIAPQTAESLIQFHDIDFPLDESVVSAVTREKTVSKGAHKVVGTADENEPVSDTACSGCGAFLHCIATEIPGYLPSEKFKALLQEGKLSSATCQRCHLLTYHQKALNIQMSKDEYRKVVHQIKSKKALVLLIIDLMDIPDSIIQDLPQLVGDNKDIIVLGNKIDLLPRDSPNYLQRIKRQLSYYCMQAGIGDQVRDIHLISARTGYGIEHLISNMQKSWKYKGDVYLVGSANAGKSTLFNTLLESDYSKSKASDLIHRATISPWPGTTLNLLKFPIISPTPYRMFLRQQRLKEASQQTEDELSPVELKKLKFFSRHGYLVGHIGRTFRSRTKSQEDVIEFDADSLAFGENDEGSVLRPAPRVSADVEFTINELKYARWLHDTPGIMKEHDVLNLLTEDEVKLVVPTQAIVPRTFVLKPAMSLFIGALSRIDFLQGENSCWFSVVASRQIPVHITTLEKADAIYQKHAGNILLGVPLGGPERMKDFPPLVPLEVKLEGRGHLEAAADIKLSSAGWVAVTAVEGDQLLLRVHSPEPSGFTVRMPPLLPNVVTLKGKRIKRSPAYKPLKMSVLLAQGTKNSRKKN
ncbi:nitric oxide-associated protein 1 isoform X2 [Thalassophryne amazonica]|uniref:nitric oxide-associated protein 1 isoform X1 n=1 Tax=Thalassophryne amazonica TaxID=390379 RepID=UPI001471FA88|nr:nitric oxide-associated protein 1 isoform X1 [Thalassophryne amazonica]XP_034038152.1 nitric oxide-associated protein 1 isoform X2 [Thalassophryne amazonica]